MPEPIISSPEGREKLRVSIALATLDDWQVYKNLRLMAITGPDKRMFRILPQREKELLSQKDEEWKNDLSERDAFVVLVRVGNKAIGMGSAKKVQRTEDTWWVQSGFFQPAFRNLKIGKKMFAFRLQEIISRGGKTVSMGVDRTNSASIHIAEFFGFKKIEEHSDQEGFYMEGDLSDPSLIQKINAVLNTNP